MNIKVGNTPLIKIKYSYKGKEDLLYTKLESYNITGSIKDRIAYYMIKHLYIDKKIARGTEIVEATSGNTGISLSAIGALFGNPVHIFMPEWASRERVSLMKLYNAKVTLISKEEGGFKRALYEARKYSEEKNAYFINQFENNDNILAHYETTGKEISDKLGELVGGFVSGVGTGGTLMGVAKRLKEENKDVKIFALEPDKMPLLSQNKIFENHKIEGIGDDFVPKIVDKDKIDKIILVNDDDSINMAKKLSLNLGLGVGISSGANVIASVLAKEYIESKKSIVTVFPDDNKKYLSTDLNGDIDRNENFISNKIKLLDYDFV